MNSTNLTNDEIVLRAEIEDRVRAVRAKDVDAVLAKYEPNVIAFDVVTPLKNAGTTALRKRLADWFASFKTGLDYGFSELSLSIDVDLAFDHHLTKVHGMNLGGQTVDMWFRETVCYRKIGGVWRITHQHSSVPIDMENGKGRMDLNP